MMICLTNESTILPNAAPMITATARSMTFPFKANAINSSNSENTLFAGSSDLTDLNRVVALKMILAGEHAGAEAAARFLAEAEAVAKLQHPNIVQIFHIDEHDGYPYFEMEYLAGGTLAAQLDGTPRPPRGATLLVET